MNVPLQSHTLKSIDNLGKLSSRSCEERVGESDPFADKIPRETGRFVFQRVRGYDQEEQKGRRVVVHVLYIITTGDSPV